MLLVQRWFDGGTIVGKFMGASDTVFRIIDICVDTYVFGTWVGTSCPKTHPRLDR